TATVDESPEREEVTTPDVVADALRGDSEGLVGGAAGLGTQGAGRTTSGPVSAAKVERARPAGAPYPSETASDEIYRPAPAPSPRPPTVSGSSAVGYGAHIPASPPPQRTPAL